MSLHALAGHMAAKGRGSDSMLVHMTPEEVQSLQVLALRAGGTLTINPETGLPEANFLKKMLPMIAGFALGPAGFGLMSAGMAGATVGGITALSTGSLSRGLMAGLGAYGGASLGAGLADAGTGAIAAGDIAAQQAAGTFPTLAEGATKEAIAKYATDVGALRDAALSKAGEAGLGAKMTAGLGQMASNPGMYAKDLLKSTYAAATPILADQMVPTTTKLSDSAQTPSYIRPFLVDQYSQQMQALTPIDASKVRMRGESGMAGGGIVALADGGISAADIQGYLAARPGLSDTQIAAAMDQFKVTPEQMAAATGLSLGDVQGRYNAAQQNISGIQNAFTQNYPTAAADDISDYIRGVGGIANVEAALGAGNMQNLYGTSEGGTPFTNAAGLYQLQTGGSFAPISSAINKWVGENVGTYKTAEAAAAARNKAEDAMLKAGMNEFDVLKATGKTLDQIFGFTPDKIVKTVTDLPGGGTGTTDTYTGGVSTTPATYAPPGTTNPYGNYMNPGDITKNPDGTITVQPNIPGRPFGGFTGMQQVRDAYTAGGGSLGYTPYVPQTIQEFENRFTTSGGSKQAYDFLMNKGAADIRRPITRTGELMLPYAEAMGLRRPGRFVMPRKPIVKKDEVVAPTPDSGEGSVGAASGGVMRMALGGVAVAGGGTARDGLQQINSGTNTVSQAIDTATSALGGVGGGGSRGYQNLLDVLRPGEAPPFNGQNNGAAGFFGMPVSVGGMPAGLDDSGMGAANATSAGPYRQGPYRQMVNYANSGNPMGGKGSAASFAEIAKQFGFGGRFANGGQVRRMALGGLGALAAGGAASQYNLGGYSDGGRLLRGPGDGVSDSIPATIGDKQPARLADGEFVVPARIVSELGNGSTEAGARKLYAMMDRVQKARGKTTGKNRVAANTRADKYLPA